MNAAEAMQLASLHADLDALRWRLQASGPDPVLEAEVARLEEQVLQFARTVGLNSPLTQPAEPGIPFAPCASCAKNAGPDRCACNFCPACCATECSPTIEREMRSRCGNCD